MGSSSFMLTLWGSLSRNWLACWKSFPLSTNKRETQNLKVHWMQNLVTINNGCPMVRQLITNWHAQWGVFSKPLLYFHCQNSTKCSTVRFLHEKGVINCDREAVAVITLIGICLYVPLRSSVRCGQKVDNGLTVPLGWALAPHVCLYVCSINKLSWHFWLAELWQKLMNW